MSKRQKRLKLSINPDLINKNDAQEERLFAEGWIDVEFTLNEFARSIRKGIAYSAQLGGRRRNKQNFVATDLISIDIDRGLTIQEALSNYLVRSHAALIYTTPSHTPEEHRFRIVFETPRTIVDGREFTAVARSLALRIGGDLNATDAPRIFFGSRDAEIDIIGESLSAELLVELHDQSAPVIERRRDMRVDGSGQYATIRSRLTIVPDQLITRANGDRVPFRDVPYKASICCPFHNDKNASAFVLQSKKGAKGLYCHSCATTFWTEKDASYDFDHFDRTMDEITIFFEEHQDWGPIFNDARAIANLRHSKINIVSGLTAPPELTSGLTLIKSPKGSGKTESIKQLTSELQSVLLVGHRIALINQSCRRLGLRSYLDSENNQIASATVRMRRFGVTIDSLNLISHDHPPYDAVVLDESEQLLAHFLSDTLDRNGGLRERLFVHFRDVLSKAKRVVALDADLDWVSYMTLYPMVSRSQIRSGQPLRNTRIWINRPPPKSGPPIELYEDEHDLIFSILRCLDEGKRCFVTSNSKTKVDTIAHAVRTTSNGKYRQILVTSDTSKNDDCARLINHPASVALQYDIILTSPSLGTGVDITFPGNQRIIDVVFGFCENGINTHYDFDQQLARVRHPRALKVWITHRKSNLETDQDVVKRDLVEHSAYVNLLTDIDDGRPIYRSSDLIDMAALIVSRQNASKNALRANFIKFKTAQGHEIIQIGVDPLAKVEGRQLYQIGKQMRAAEYTANILGSQSLPFAELSAIKNDIEADLYVPPEKRFAYERTWLELFYREAASEALLQADDTGRTRNKVLLLEGALSSNERYGIAEEHEWLKRAPDLPKQLRYIRDRRAREELVRAILEMTPVMKEGIFQAEVFSSDELKPLVSFLLQNKAAFEQQLGIEVRADVAKKSVQQLGNILRQIGLSLSPLGRVKRGNERAYVYRLEPHDLETVLGIVERRKNVDAWGFLENLYSWPPHRRDDDDDHWPRPRRAAVAAAPGSKEDSGGSFGSDRANVLDLL